jgi:hypothetical protein
VFTARYALSPYIKQIRFVFKVLMLVPTTRISSTTERTKISGFISVFPPDSRIIPQRAQVTFSTKSYSLMVADMNLCFVWGVEAWIGPTLVNTADSSSPIYISVALQAVFRQWPLRFTGVSRQLSFYEVKMWTPRPTPNLEGTAEFSVSCCFGNVLVSLILTFVYLFGKL